jgi:hypothetical protein
VIGTGHGVPADAVVVAGVLVVFLLLAIIALLDAFLARMDERDRSRDRHG